MSELTFEEESHTYTYRGRPVPGVTRVLDALHDFRSVPADVLDAAAAFGTHVHKAIALDLIGQLHRPSLDVLLAPYVDAAKRFLSDYNVTVLSVERRVVAHNAAYAGTLDLQGSIQVRGKPRDLVVDWKSGSTMPATVGPQTAAYQRALDPLALLGFRWGVLLCPDDTVTPYRVTKCTDPSDWNVFLSALNCYQWRQLHG